MAVMRLWLIYLNGSKEIQPNILNSTLTHYIDRNIQMIGHILKKPISIICFNLYQIRNQSFFSMYHLNTLLFCNI